ncbi:unnamed protein product, partial [Prorocentrum cordatum]
AAAPRAACQPARAPRAMAQRETRAAAAQRLTAQRGPVGSLTVLEQIASRPKTEVLYKKTAPAFLEYCTMRGLDWRSVEEMDVVLALHLNGCFQQGVSSDHGTQVPASLCPLLPEPAWRAEVAVAASGPRLDRAEASGACGNAAAVAAGGGCVPAAGGGGGALDGCLGRPVVSVWMAVWPGETSKLHGRNLIPPSPAAGLQHRHWALLLHDVGSLIPGKTGLRDESVVIDLDPWLVPALEYLRSTTSSDSSLWSFTVAALRPKHSRRFGPLGLPQVSDHMCCHRHGGASDDVLSRRRDAFQVQLRGRWASVENLKRYDKETKFLSELSWVHGDVFRLGHLMMEHFWAACTAGGIEEANIGHRAPATCQPAVRAARRLRQ